jgi:hypothetical protein
VEVAFPDPGTWPVFVTTVKLRWSGQVDMDEKLTAQVFAGLRRHDPWPKAAGPCSQ